MSQDCQPITLVLIGERGEVPAEIVPSEHLGMLLEMTMLHFQKVGFVPPWVGYIAIEHATPVGTCAFKSPPVDGRVEIAYGTLPGFEGRGIATAMARELIQIAWRAEARLTIVAQTLPEENASTSILKKLGFRWVGPVEHPEDGMIWEWELQPA